MTAEEHLRRLVDVGCEQYGCDGYASTASCFFCEGEAGFIDEVNNRHKSDCPYIAARKFLQQQDAARRFLEEMGERLEEGFKP